MIKKCMMMLALSFVFCLQASHDSDSQTDYSGEIEVNDDFVLPDEELFQLPIQSSNQQAVATHIRFDDGATEHDATEEELPISSRFPLSLRTLQTLKEKQAAAAIALANIIEVGTLAEFHTQIAQFFIYQGQSYRNIELDVFFTEFNHVIELFVADLQQSMTLGFDAELQIHDQLKLDSTTRQVEQYKIIGATLPERWSEIINGRAVEQREAIFNISRAKRRILSKVKNYIDNNLTAVRAQCVGSGLSISTSKDVWEPGCCDIQMHRSCFKQCKHNKVSQCINPFCQKIQEALPSGQAETKVYSLNWTERFYEDVLSQKPVVAITKIRDEACPVCMENLKPEIPAILLPVRKKARTVKNHK